MEVLTVSGGQVRIVQRCSANCSVMKDPAVQVFGWGSWLKEHSNTVEAEQFAKTFQEKTVSPESE